MEISEVQIRQQLIDRLLELGYPKASIVFEVILPLGRGRRASIDLAVKDPDTNQVLAIFEIKRNLVNLENAMQQVISYSHALSENVQAFLYGYRDGSESIFLVNTKENIASQVFDLPTYESLKNIEFSLENMQKNADIFKKHTANRWSSIVAGMTSSMAIAISIAMFAGLFFDENKTLSNSELTEKINLLHVEKKKLESEVDLLKSEISTVENGLKAISSVPDKHGWNAEAIKLSANIEKLKQRLDALEKAITEDPAKALAVPILRKDLDNAEKSLKAELAQTKLEIDRMYDQNKWFIGLMFTIALSVLGMAASSFFNRKDT